MMRSLALLCFVACGGEPRPPPVEPTWPAPATRLHVTKGRIAGMRVSDPAVRGVAPDSRGDRGALDILYLDAAGERAQLGLKLHAQDSCNVIYVMWRLAPVEEIVVQVKRNPGATLHRECGTAGYTRVKPAWRTRPPAIASGSRHRLAAAIERGPHADELVVWVDQHVVWRGSLPAIARELRGPLGFRTDHVVADISLRAEKTSLHPIRVPHLRGEQRNSQRSYE